MSQTEITETADFYRRDTSHRLDAKRRSALGQYMTATPLARFLASLFDEPRGDICLLDPGAGVGSLTAAFAERLCHQANKPRSASFVCYEIEPLMLDYLRGTLQVVEQECTSAQIKALSHVHETDFILSNAGNGQSDIFVNWHGSNHEYTHVIVNPPYKKINTASEHRKALCKAGIETSNL